MLFFDQTHLASFDFEIVSNTLISGVSLIMPLNEQAYDYVTDECDYDTLKDGSVPLFNEVVGDFISDAESAHLSCNYI